MRTFLFAIGLIVLLGSCTDSTCDDEDFNLIGRWQLIEFCFSPGNASCPIQTPEEIEIMEFKGDSTYTYSIGAQSSAGTFTVVENRVLFINSNENPDITDRFLIPLNSCRLELNPLCSEECRAVFEKID